jgi:Holliday junction resolvase RusA-like endonuclease
MKVIDLTLPLPPSVNQYQPHANRGGRCVRYLSSEAKKFKSEVMALVDRENASQGILEPLRVILDIFPRDRRRQDIDNRIKPCLDALQSAGVFEDDSQIVELVVRKHESVKGGMVNVRIEVVG